MYRTIETMTLKDGTHIDRVNRYDSMEGIHGAKARLWFFLYNCTADPNLTYAHCAIMDDNGAIYKTDEYRAVVEEVVPETIIQEQ